MKYQDKYASKQEKSLFNYWDLPKNYNLIQNAKQLRKAGILSEVIFWSYFKDKSKLGWDIDRQVIIGNYIVDFFIDELGLVFEIDGSSHNDKTNYDMERDKYLESLDIKVVHISDLDIKKDIDAVYRFVIGSVNDRVEELKKRVHPVIAERCHPSMRGINTV